MTLTPWRDKTWLTENLDRHGGYDNRMGNASRGAMTLLAAELGCSKSTLSLWARKHQLEPTDRAEPEPPPLVPIESEEWVFEGDFGCSSDWHAPITRYDVMERMLDDCTNNGLTRHIIAGDLTNQDALSGHEEKQKGACLEVEQEHLNYSLDRALDLVDEIVVTLGNHDRHIKNKTGMTLAKSLKMLLTGLSREKLDRIKITERDYVLLTGGRSWNLAG